MRLEITRRADLAVRGLIALGTGGRHASAALAERLGTTPGFLSHAMTPLVSRGWVRSVPGPGGGYTLDAALDDISVLAAIEAVEGTTDVTRCVMEDRACRSAATCALHHPWTDARTALLDRLGDTRLGDLVSAGDQP